MASEFHPGHPVAFWVAIIAVTFALFSAARAAITFDECARVGSGAKHWSAWPPEWVCDGQHGQTVTTHDEHWFEPLARFAGPAYLRYSFTKGTEQEVAFLWDALDLAPGKRVLDVGCGPGRHAHGFASRGAEVVGVDLAAEFVELAKAGAPVDAWFVRGDARALPVAPRFDAVVSLCQGGFGLLAGEDSQALSQMAAATKPGGLLALSAFSAYFAVRFLEEQDTFDADAGVNHERTSVRNEAGDSREFDLWTSCFTPHELRLLCAAAGLEVLHLWAVTPGDYARRPPDLDHAEWLLVARKGTGSNVSLH